MNFDKLMNSKVNQAADWILRLVLVNILVIVCSLPVITLYPAFSAGYNVFHDIISKKNPKVFSNFFQHFRLHLGKKIGVGLVFIVFVGIIFWNTTYYAAILEQQTNTFILIGYYVTIALLASLYAIYLYTYVILCAVPTIRVTYLLKLSFFMAGKYYLITLLLVVVNSLPILMFLYPPTAVLFVFFGVSLPLLIHAILTRRVVVYLENLGETND